MSESPFDRDRPRRLRRLPCVLPALSQACPECGSTNVEWISWDSETQVRRYKCLACKHEWGVGT